MSAFGQVACGDGELVKEGAREKYDLETTNRPGKSSPTTVCY